MNSRKVCSSNEEINYENIPTQRNEIKQKNNPTEESYFDRYFLNSDELRKQINDPKKMAEYEKRFKEEYLKNATSGLVLYDDKILTVENNKIKPITIEEFYNEFFQYFTEKLEQAFKNKSSSWVQD